MLCTNHLRTPARTGWSCACIGLVVIATMVGCSSSDDDDEAESTTGGSSSEDSASGGAAATAAGGSAGATVSGSVKITQMDDGRRIYLAARYIDSNNWHGAALHNAGTRRGCRPRARRADCSRRRSRIRRTRTVSVRRGKPLPANRHTGRPRWAASQDTPRRARCPPMFPKADSDSSRYRTDSAGHRRSRPLQ